MAEPTLLTSSQPTQKSVILTSIWGDEHGNVQRHGPRRVTVHTVGFKPTAKSIAHPRSRNACLLMGREGSHLSLCGDCCGYHCEQGGRELNACLWAWVAWLRCSQLLRWFISMGVSHRADKGHWLSTEREVPLVLNSTLLWLAGVVSDSLKSQVGF